MKEDTMKEESTNARKLHERRKFSYARVASYRERFIDPETGRFHEHLVMTRACPVCGSASYATVFEKDGGTTVKCADCTMVYLNPCFTEEALADYYREFDTGQAEITALESDFYREVFNRGLDVIERHVAPGRILDVGCSSGFFLDNARKRGWKTAGLEPGVREAELAVGKGHEIHTQPLAELTFAARFEAVCLWDVFEHILDGKRFWKLLDSNLTPHGVVFLQIPNADSLAARTMREHSRMHDGLEHVNLYNPRTIALLAESVGYRIAEMRSVISEISVLNNYLHYDDPYFGASSYGPSVLGILDEHAIHERLLGYKLQIALQRA